MTRLEKERGNYPGMTDEEIIGLCCPEDPLGDHCPYPLDGHAGCVKHWNEEAES